MKSFRIEAFILISMVLLLNIKLMSCEGPSFECLAAYSKSRGLNEPEFASVTYDSMQQDCVAAIRKFSDKVRSDIIEKMSEVTSDAEQTKCINGKFINDDTFVNNIIKGEALASLSVDKEKSDKLSAVESFAEEFITMAISTCLGVKDVE
ncbi:hypothetical protein PVAND_007564 [Polypedilum vanderplanki]|uniref:Pectinesterase inhibitor domain-containing protein n=1 Tax=Polypedilum vanderplanki TaxID=319348 RepID=A0A9J6C725_POLVA|nr:hypothetical protein PVAND_007564 [Polypedilum vanderplanki]